MKPKVRIAVARAGGMAIAAIPGRMAELGKRSGLVAASKPGYLSELGRKGGLKSAEARRKLAAERVKKRYCKNCGKEHTRDDLFCCDDCAYRYHGSDQ